MNKFFINTPYGLTIVSPSTPVKADISSYRMAKNIMGGVYNADLVYPATIDHIGYLIEKLNRLIRVDSAYTSDIKAIVNYKQALQELNGYLFQVEPDYAGMAVLNPTGEITLGIPSDGHDIEDLSAKEILDKLLLEGTSVPIVYSSRELDSLVDGIDWEVRGLCEVLQHTYDENLTSKIKDDITRMTSIRNGVLFGLSDVNKEIHRVRYLTH